MSKNSKRRRLQTTAASDIAPTRLFTHSSNTATRTRQIVSAVKSDPTNSMTPLPVMDSEVDSNNNLAGTVELDHPAGVEVLKKPQRYINSVWKILWSDTGLINHSQDLPLLTWKKYRGEYLDACLILEGRGRFHESCANTKCCQGSTATFRCVDCFGYSMFCKDCIVSAHYINPLHRIEVWDHINDV